MSKPQHSPGTWNVGRFQSYVGLAATPVRYVYRGEEETAFSRIAVYGRCPKLDQEEQEGPQFNCDEDAALIAAAPELLAAAKEFVAKVDRGEARSKKSYAAFKAAIAKAEDWE